LTVNVSNFLATLFRQLLTLALVNLTIYVMRFLLPIRMQKRPGISMRNIFQNNLCIIEHNSLSYLPVGICHNLHIAMRNSLSRPSAGICRNLHIAARNSLSCPSVGIHRNLRIATHNSVSYPLAGIRRTLLLKSSNVPLLGKTVPTNTRVLQKGLLFLFVH
jgi:hypothetical protein